MTNTEQLLRLSQDSAIRLQHSVDALRETISDQEKVAKGIITQTAIQRLQDAIEGYCDGLAVDDENARAILYYVFTGSFEETEHE